jgi:anti-sigma regulatory factor (Ser/Thr protein kinase)
MSAERPGGNVSATTAAQYKAQYRQAFHGQPDQVRAVRHAVASYVNGCPRADDVVLVASELATNAIVHSNSREKFFSVACQLYADYCWIEVEDLGGKWQCRGPDERPHGLDIVDVLAGAGNWGVETTGDGNRVVWARLAW